MMIHLHKSYVPRGLKWPAIRRALIVATVTAVLGLNWASPALGASWETVKNFAPLGTGPNPFPLPEDVQLGGISGIAVNNSGAGGVAKGTLYTIGVSNADWHVARFSPAGVFELGWNAARTCGPSATPCPTYPDGSGGRTGIAVNQTTGIVYVFHTPGTPQVFSMYSADGTPFGTPFGEQEFPGTVSASPSKIHFSPESANIAVDPSGDVYVVDEDIQTDNYHRLMVFEPETPGNFEHYVYAGIGRDIAGGFGGVGSTRTPSRPQIDNAGNIFVAGETYIEEYDPAQPNSPSCKFNLPTGGITAMAVDPATGAPFYYTYKPVAAIHQLKPCNSEGLFTEAGPAFSVNRQRGTIEGLAYSPNIAFKADGTIAETPVQAAFGTGAIYAGAPQACPFVGGCPKEAQGQSSLGYIFAPQLSPEAPKVISEEGKSVGSTLATLGASINPGGPSTSYTFQYIPSASYGAQKATNEQQSVTVAASGGTFKLEAGPQITGALNFDASAAAVQGALEKLSVIGTGNVEVSGGPGDSTGSSPYVLTFVAGLGETNVPELVVDGAGLTGAEPLAAVGTIREGVDGFLGAAESPSPSVSLGSGRNTLLAATRIAGLVPGEAYRYRVVATNNCVLSSEMICRRVGEAQGFRTFAPRIPGLPDSRAFELVSPVQKNGGEVLPGQPLLARCGPECKPGLAAPRFPVEVAPDGSGIAYQGQPFLTNEGAAEYDEYVSKRTSSGWQTTSMSPPLEGDGAMGGQQFRAFSLSPDLAKGITYATNNALTPGAPAGYRNLFSEPVGDRLSLAPIFTKSVPNRPTNGAEAFAISYVGASSDFSRIFFEANEALTGATGSSPEAVEGGAGEFKLYEWSGGQTHLVNVLPGNVATEANAAFGSGTQLANPALIVSNFSHAISSDGSRVFWTDLESGAIYVREQGDVTREIPSPDTCRKSVAPSQRTCFLSASADGSRVLLSDGTIYDLETMGTTSLTNEQGAFTGIVGQSEDLSHVYYVMGPVNGTGDLSVGSTTVSTVGAFKAGQTIEGNGIQPGTKIASVGPSTLELSAPATASGTAVNLVAQGSPAEGLENSEGATPQTAGINLYAWHEGTISFVATLETTDDGALGTWRASPAQRAAEASPDGRWLAFNSEAALTGANTVGPCRWDSTLEKFAGSFSCPEVYLYDSQSGSLTCPSCNPTNTAPLGASRLRVMELAQGYLVQPRYLTDSGRLYFDSQDSLSPLDGNKGIEDVYQYEPVGVGSCSEAGGCVSLITSGTGSYDSNFLAMDPSGDNVFFTTRQQLVSVDRDQLIDVYDARVGGGLPSDNATPPGECAGEGCQGSFAPAPSGPSPGSTTVEGSGNVVPKKPKCQKGKVRKGGHCVKKKQHKKHRAKHQRGGAK